MKKLKWLFIALGIIIIGIIVYFIIKQSLREEAILTFPDTIIVQNATEYKELEKLSKAIIYNVLEYDTMNIGITYMPKQMERIGELDIKAYILKNIFQKYTYLILVSTKLKSSEYKMIMSHEMVHLDQYERGDLQSIGLESDRVIYKGDTIDYYDLSYDERPHEIDAHKQDNRIYRQLEKVLYK